MSPAKSELRQSGCARVKTRRASTAKVVRRWASAITYAGRIRVHLKLCWILQVVTPCRFGSNPPDCCLSGPLCLSRLRLFPFPYETPFPIGHHVNNWSLRRTRARLQARSLSSSDRRSTEQVRPAAHRSAVVGIPPYHQGWNRCRSA